VEGEPQIVVSAALLPEGLHARLIPRDGAGWTIRPLRPLEPGADRAWHLVAEAVNQILGGGEGFACASDGLRIDHPGSPLPLPRPEGRGAGGGVEDTCTLKAADLAFDSDYEFFSRKGESNNDTCMAIIEAGLDITNAIYLRDLKVVHRLTTVVLRTDPAADFYARFPDASDFGAMLSAFRSEWNANMPQVTRDMAYLLTGKPNPGLGGLAYVGVVCTNFAYGMGIGGWGYEGIFRHEAGHNWGAGHSCGTERRYIMCGNSISAFSAFNIRIMAAHRDSRNCLDEVPNASDPAPPYVRLDRIILLEGGGPTAIDAVSEDTDPNCVPPRLVSHDARSAFGAAILPLDPLAPGRADALLYSPRTDLLGTDHFGYVVEDGTGNRAEGSVLVEVRPRGLVVHLKLDETSGTAAADSGGLGHDGEFRGGLDFAVDSVPGRHGRALKLSGVDGEYVSLGDDPDFDLQRGLTVALWFRFDALAAAGNETLAGKGPDAWGLRRDGTRPSLKFTCTGLSGGGAAAEARGSKRIDDQSWHHAAGVYDGSRVFLYLDGELDVSLPASGLIRRNADSLRIGDGLFNGAVDEVRLYNHALDAEAVRSLFQDGRVEGADPPDGKAGVVPGSGLSWQAPPSAVAYEVYLGESAAAVAGAGPASPEFRGRLTATRVAPRTEPDRVYFWRVDPVVGGAARKGQVRRFSTSFAHTDFNEPALNSANFTPSPAHRELGFRTTTTATGGQDPLAAVISTSSTPSSPVFSHRSLKAVTAFGEVDLAGRGGAAISLILQARDTEYEEGQDRVEVYATGGAERLRLLRLDGGNALTQRAGIGYSSFAAILPEDWARASLVVSSSSDSSQGSERYDFDQVAFFCRRPRSVIAYSHFAEPPAGAASYAPGASGKELGFRTAATATGAGSRTGVVEAGASISSRLLEHRSARATTTFDAVDLAGREGARVTVTLRVLSTGYEVDDTLEAAVSDGARRIELVKLNGDTGLDELAGEYVSFWADLPADWRSATLVISTASNSSAGAEGYQVRAVEFLSALEPALCGEPPPPPALFRRGDANGDGVLDLSDGVGVLDYLFLGGILRCLDAADVNDSGGLDLSDGVATFSFLFLGGPAPRPPGPDACGPDPSADPLDCADDPACP
jgi:hypothetical protein